MSAILSYVVDSASPDSSSTPLQQMLAVLDLEARGVDDRGQDVFTGPSQLQPHGRVFGGQVLGQTVMAAGRTCPDGRSLHSMHGYFLRPGDPETDITFTVERLRDGRSFSARRVHALQDGRPILSMIGSFQEPAEGLDHQDEMPDDVPGPEGLPTTRDLLGHIDHPVARYWATSRPIDIRYVTQPLYLASDPHRTARQAVWLRADGRLPDGDLLHRAVLGYASDYTLLEVVLRRHGLSWVTPGLRMASLDHAMWWHRPARADEWLLYVAASPSASGARSLSAGKIFDRSGALVASVAQEGMVRAPLPEG